MGQIARNKGPKALQELGGGKLSWSVDLSTFPSEKWLNYFQRAIKELHHTGGPSAETVRPTVRLKPTITFDAAEGDVPRFIEAIDAWIEFANNESKAEREQLERRRKEGNARVEQLKDRLDKASETFKDL